ncbi:hypothetical protein GPECTOR_63g47 [Gonium pectorale]|uniref:TFIIB-type domain-containing protein n=1 Tax=Gonium pectorale TaxID=33097 RepID=A0A150G4H3_GONPE|nr:hypothetical protein GPECTOR_63g47 [Gonium pectorale]|eukprot:KXZ44721.1 hypothetical protein GPECTOR_63g47 [Gonium pectorale]
MDAPCPRCAQGAIEYDASGACYVCQNCGYVPEEAGFVSYEETAAAHGEEQQPFRAGSRGDGGGGLAPGPHGSRLAAAARSAADPSGAARQRRQRSQLEDLGALAATLRLPGPVTQLAAGFLARLHAAAGGEAPGQRGAAAEPKAGCGADGAAEPAPAAAGGSGGGRAPPLGGAQSSARLASLLYLASRSEHGSLTLAEVAAATSTDMFRIGEMARQQAAFLQLALPGVDVERFVMRMAMELVLGALGEQQQQEDEEQREEEEEEEEGQEEEEQGDQGHVEEGEQNEEGDDEQEQLGRKRKRQEDRHTNHDAAGDAGGAARWGSGRRIRRQLLLLASGLPFGALLGPHNLPSYLEVILEAEHVLGPALEPGKAAGGS